MVQVSKFVPDEANIEYDVAGTSEISELERYKPLTLSVE
jgi:hypothetical protein